MLLLASVRGNYLCSWLCLFVVWFTFSGFSGFIPQVPIQVLAVTGSASGASVVFHSNVAASLLADGTNLASKLFAKFQTTSSQFQHQGKFKILLHLLRRVTEWGLEAPILGSRIQRADLLRAMEVKELGNRLRTSLPPCLLTPVVTATETHNFALQGVYTFFFVFPCAFLFFTFLLAFFSWCICCLFQSSLGKETRK